eukprot:TRINITY_DN106491_c0_g1_i5.p1 TRINITY_DN106491_c0_g1~~TRINITY_DN106491_c0_g1_i5.p1  ORF type:complete len:101 (+),score=19.81 TRINITY_DN106491_c0_g1_i5:183-485(+)
MGPNTHTHTHTHTHTPFSELSVAVWFLETPAECSSLTVWPEELEGTLAASPIVQSPRSSPSCLTATTPDHTKFDSILLENTHFANSLTLTDCCWVHLWLY